MILPEISDDVRAGISADVAKLLSQADLEIAALKPRCDASGRCCHFEEYGHRLYITMAELIHFALVTTRESLNSAVSDNASHPIKSEAKREISLPQFFASAQLKGCPYQQNNLCHARNARPLGCRIYFCDPDAQSWQNSLYERYHRELKEIHQRWNVEYAYIEWRASLDLALQSGWLPS